MSHYFWDKRHPQSHTPPHMQSSHTANVSHVFRYLGRFLPPRRHIKQRTVFHNFCQMTQCYVTAMLFQLDSAAWHQGGQQLSGTCHGPTDIILSSPTPRNPCFSNTDQFLFKIFLSTFNGWDLHFCPRCNSLTEMVDVLWTPTASHQTHTFPHSHTQT